MHTIPGSSHPRLLSVVAVALWLSLVSTIAAATAGAPVLTSSPQLAVKVGEAFSVAVTATNSPTSFGLVGTLPEGVAFDAATGVLSGTPATLGNFPLTLTAQNATGVSDAVAAMLKVYFPGGTWGSDFTTPALTKIGVVDAFLLKQADPTTGVATAPGAPTIVSAVGGNAQATVSFTAPANNGGASITGYTVTATPVGGGSAVTRTGPGSPVTVAGLTNGTSYTFTVAASNSAGTGAASSASAVAAPGGNWAQNFGTSSKTCQILAMVNDAAGNVYVAGNFNGTTQAIGGTTLTKMGSFDAFVAKFSPAGAVIWAKNCGGSGASAYGQSIAVDSAGGVYLSGYFQSASLTTPVLTLIGAQDAFAVKFDATGAVTWAKNFGGSEASAYGDAVAVDGAGNVYLGGYFQGADLTTPTLAKMGINDAFALKLDPSGVVTWAKNFGGSGASAYGKSMAVDGAGRVYLGGYFQNTDLTTPALTKIGTCDAFALQLDATGAVAWAKNFGGSGVYAYGSAVAVDGAGSVYLCGYYTNGGLTTPALARIGAQDAFALKLDATGAVTWARSFGGSSGATAYGMGTVVDRAGNVYLSGTFYGFDLTTPAVAKIGTQDAVVLKLDASGAVTWAKSFGGGGATAYGYGIAVDDGGNVYQTGFFFTANLTTPALTKIGTYDAFLIKRAYPFAEDGTAPAAPVVTTQPQSQTVGAGGSATISVMGSGTAPLSFQWYQGASPSTTTPVSGATAATFTTPALSATTTYWVRVSNGAGAADSSTATVTVSSYAPTVALTSTTTAEYLGTGGTATLRVRVTYTGQSPLALGVMVNLPADWTFGTYNGPAAATQPAVGSNVLEWSFSTMPTGELTCTFTVVYPAGQTGSKSITGSVNYRPGPVDVPFTNLVLTPAISPTITTQPTKKVVAVGTGTTFTVSASGTSTLGYQWKKDGAALTDGGRISGATTATLSLASLTLADAGSYTVLVSNTAGSTSSTAAALTVVDAQATHAVSGAGYSAGGTVTLSQTLRYTSTSTGLGWQMLLPTGWSYASGGGTEGDVKPAVGTTSLLEWAWTTLPASPATFTVTLNVPAGQTGDQSIAALAIFRVSAGAAQILAQPDPLVVSQITNHSADQNKNFQISLLELTRVIELYNTRNGTTRTGCYRVEATGEDGYAPEPTRTNVTAVTLGAYHSADSNRDGKLSLLELTRVIELYNYRVGTSRTGQYHVSAGTDDGFAPGL